MRQTAIAFTALAFLAGPAAAAKCDDYGTCRVKRNYSAVLQTAALNGQAADDSADSAVRQTTELQATPPAPQTDPPPDEYSYRIGVQDVLEIHVFQAPELTQTLQVGPNGQIRLPLIGSVQAGGKTASEVEAEIASRLKDKYLKDPQVNIYIKEFNSQRITVTGAVSKPGYQQLAGQTTLLQVVAASGGFNESANPKNVVVFRTIRGQRSAAKFNMKKIEAGKALDPNIQSGDIIVVAESSVRGWLNNVIKALPLTGIFSPLLGL